MGRFFFAISYLGRWTNRPCSPAQTDYISPIGFPQMHADVSPVVRISRD